jgi:predicted dehydrogenase
MDPSNSRRSFLRNVGFGSLAAIAVDSWTEAGNAAPDASVLGDSGVATSERPKNVWQPVSDRKIRIGIAGYGVCQFGAAFGFQDHPNVTVAAVTDLLPDRCGALAKACRCEKIYPSLEDMVKDDTLEAVFVATDAPSHARHCLEAVKHGKHVGTAVPAVFGSLDDAHELYATVGKSGRQYMMFETSAFRGDCHAMRQIFRAGGFGKLVYSEGEYYHYSEKPIPSFHEWRVGLPPQWYPTHATAYYVCVTGGHFTEVSCLGMPDGRAALRSDANRYHNPFGTEVALLRTGEGGMARMVVSFDTPGGECEVGRVRGLRGSMSGTTYTGDERRLPDLECPPLPPGVAPGGHGGSHGHLMNEFVTAILEDRKPLVDLATALKLTVPGIVAHQSAINGGETRKIPVFA